MREFNSYEKSLSHFCMAYRDFYQYAKREKRKVRVVKELASDLATARDELLRKKSEYGLTGGLDFLEEAYFDEFEIRDGEVVGDIIKAYKWADMWATRYLEGKEKSELFLEVAFLIFALIPYDRYLDALARRDAYKVA